MSALGDFLELWVERNVLPTSAERNQTARLAEKLAGHGSECLTLDDLELPPDGAEAYIEDIIVHIGEPGTASD